MIRIAEAEMCGGKYDKALAELKAEQAMETPPDTWGMNALAWLYATCPDVKYRDGAKAIELAKKGGDGDTLAAAYAEAGRWDEAVAEEKKAIADDTEEEQKVLTYSAGRRSPGQTAEVKVEDDLELSEETARLHLYEQKKPCREMKTLPVGN